ncbi:MAG: hypothetical protein OEV40_31910, partial [Acidimicrobiia bacterium]|nr:hypothetical protein [Acidimicrobiia bacterium]
MSVGLVSVGRVSVELVSVGLVSVGRVSVGRQIDGWNRIDFDGVGRGGERIGGNADQVVALGQELNPAVTDPEKQVSP